MPNWCDTCYKCVGDPKEVRSLYEIIKENDKRETPRVKNGFGKLWLGCIIDQFGYDWEKYSCWGEITDYSIEDDVLTIVQNTACNEQSGFRRAIEEKFSSIKVYFQEIEPGCEVFCTNSFDYFPEMYYLDSYDEQEFWDNIDDANAYCRNIVGHEVDNTFEAIVDAYNLFQERCEEEGKDCFYSFHEFTLIED